MKTRPFPGVILMLVVVMTASICTAADHERPASPLPVQGQANPEMLRPVDDTTILGELEIRTSAKARGFQANRHRVPPQSSDRFSPEEQSLVKRAKNTLTTTALIGGDDVAMWGQTDPWDIEQCHVSIAENGDIYVALEVFSTPLDNTIKVFRSQDGGDSFEVWGIAGGPGEVRLSDLCVAEGDENVCLVYFNSVSATGYDQFVAISDLSLPAASWITNSAFSAPGVGFWWGELISDAESFDSYYLYAVCSGYDGDGDDIWYSRSTDFGTTWSAPYRIASISSDVNLLYWWPHIDWGFGGALHVAWTFIERSPTVLDGGVRYRRALNYGGSVGDWDPSVVALRVASDGIEQSCLDVCASKSSNRLLVAHGENWAADPHISTTNTAGANWSSDVALYPLPWDYMGTIKYRAADTAFVGVGEAYDFLDSEIVRAQAPESTPGSWSALQRFNDRNDEDLRSRGFALDPSRGHRVGTIFYEELAPGFSHDHILFFDAEWRNDPGYPNLEPGFPVSLASRPSGPPAIANVNTDPYDEIVFGTVAGNLWVYSHLGTVVAGWPQNVGSLADGAPVAVGALDLSGEPYIVAGTSTGKVFAYTPDGYLRDGFPVDLGTGTDVHVSIGALGPPYPRWIVACSGEKLFTISSRGSFGTFNFTYSGPIVGSAAIGDVDNDGIAEMVTLSGPDPGTGYSHVRVQEMDNNLADMKRTFPVDGFNDAPILFDLDGDGDLEIAAPTNDSKLYVMHHDGSDVLGFPFDNGSGRGLTSVAAAHFIGSSEPDLAVGSEDGQAHLLLFDGSQQASYPEVTPWPIFSAPIIDQVNRTSSNIILGTQLGMGWSFQNTGGTPPGWPKSFGYLMDYGPASGDIDLDGDNEIVFMTQATLNVVDVNYPPEPLPQNRWPMYGYDAQRTGCLNCVEDLVSPAPDSGITRVSFAPPAPNPSSGSLVFKYQIPVHASVRLEVYDLRGRRVRSVLRSEEAPGPYTVSFDGLDQKGRALATGQYFARLTVRGPGVNEVQTRKILLLR